MKEIFCLNCYLNLSYLYYRERCDEVRMFDLNTYMFMSNQGSQKVYMQMSIAFRQSGRQSVTGDIYLIYNVTQQVVYTPSKEDCIRN